MKQCMYIIRGLVFSFLMLGIAPNTFAQLFSDTLGDGSAWSTNASSSDTSVTFGYDYSVDGIPEAPNNFVAGPLALATTGIKVEANINLPTSAETISIFPVEQNFTGNYQLRFDAWINYDVDERLNGSSAGTTEFIGGGIGYNGTSSDVDSGAQIIASGDGGSGSDWRVHKDGILIAAGDMTAGSRNGSAVAYTDFLPGVLPPSGQNQSDFVDGFAGSPGFQWITFEITNIDGMVSFDIEKPDQSRLNIAVVDCAEASSCTTDGNISLLYDDLFSSVTPRPDLTFGIFDNVIVTAVEAAGLGGDYNDNGVVDAADYTLWLANLGSNTALANENPAATTPGVVDEEDYQYWKSQFGASIGTGTAGSGAIPEPASVVMLLIASAFACVARRRV